MKIYLYLMFLIFLGCGKSENKIIYLSSDSRLDNKLKYPTVFIPNAGCPGCISQAEEILLTYKGANYIDFVLCRVISRKQLNVKLGQDILNYSNISLDTIDILSKLNITGFYPVILYSKDSLVEISPSFPTAGSDLVRYLESLN